MADVTSIRDRMKDVISKFLSDHVNTGMDQAYELACDLADNIFDEFGIFPETQDKAVGLVPAMPNGTVIVERLDAEL